MQQGATFQEVSEDSLCGALQMEPHLAMQRIQFTPLLQHE